MNETEERSARLLFGEELALGEVDPATLDTPDVAEAVRDRPVPSRVGRWLQTRALARGKLEYEQFSVAPMLAARAAVLGDRAAGPPRLLLRQDAPPDVAALPDELTPEDYSEAAKEHLVVTAGPSAVATLGWHPTPLWRGSAVYMPFYLEGPAAVPVVERLVALQAALWVPVGVDELPDELRTYVRGWDEFLAGVRASR